MCGDPDCDGTNDFPVDLIMWVLVILSVAAVFVSLELW